MGNKITDGSRTDAGPRGSLMQNLRHHGVREFHRNESDDDFYAEEVRKIGFTVVSSGFSAAQLQKIREKIDRIYDLQLQEIGGADQLNRIDDGNVARSLIGYDDYFIKLAAHPRMMSINKLLLGEYFILMSQNAIINDPQDAHYQLTWHRDLNYQHFVSSRPLATSALFCIDEFSPETGGTFVLPASHKDERFPSPEYIAKHEIQVSAPAGSILLFDAMVYHRAGENKSSRLRRAVNHIYTLPLIKQQISFPKMLGDKFQNDPELRRFLGYETETADSVQQWRQFKLKQRGFSQA
jgi:ectoine hydroxylase-related dioxygenase (phytanoyl-CoA dioxygenase family)